MIRILVVEDEIPILRSICSLIEQTDSEFQVAARARNGKEALDILDTQVIDVVFLDIHMPVMDGMEILQELQKKELDVLIVVLSGYQDFEYVRMAMRHGAVDYLLKPAKREELKRVLYEVESRVIERNLHKNKISLEEQHREYELAVIYADHCFEKYEQNEKRKRLKDELTKFLKNKLEENEYWSIKGRTGNEFIVMMKKFGRRNEKLLKEFLNSVYRKEEAHSVFMYQNEMNHEKVFKIYTMLHEIAMENMLLDEDSFRMVSEKDELRLQNQEMINQAKQKLRQTSCPENIMSDMQFVLQNIPHKRGVIVEILYQAYLIYGNKFGENEKNIWNISDMNDLVEQCRTIEDILKKLETLIVDTFYIQDDNSVQLKERLAVSLKEYMEQHYSEKISNQDLAEKFGFVENHLRKLFKGRYGMSPMDYLQMIRIAKSKELLRENMPVKVVAQRVGFQDALYFSKIFKKIEGCSPREYRECQRI